MGKSSLIAAAVVALAGSVGVAAAQRSTMYDWSTLSPSQAEFMVQHQHTASSTNQSKPTKVTQKANSTGQLTPSERADPPSTGNPGGQSSLSGADNGVIIRGAIARPQPLPPEFHPATGATVPQSVRLYAFDLRVQELVPAAKKYDYVTLPNRQVLLVDPGSRKVMAMIEPKEGGGHK